MALEMEDITPAKDGGVLKKMLKQGTGSIVPDKAIVRGACTQIRYDIYSSHMYVYVHLCVYTYIITYVRSSL